MREKGKIKNFCNECLNLNLSEEEQNRIKKDTGRCEDHVCNVYKKRVFHNCISIMEQHYRIFPCYECLKNSKFKPIGKNTFAPNFKPK